MEQTHTALACSPFPALDTAAPPWDCLLRIEATMSLCPSPCVGVCRHAYPSGCSCCAYYKLQKDMLKTTVTSPEPYWNSDWTETMTQKKKKRHITHLSDSKQCFKSLMSLSGFPSLLAWSLTSRRNMEAVSVQCNLGGNGIFLKSTFHDM